MSTLASLVDGLAGLLQPLFGAGAAAAAIVLITALVRFLVHPFSRAAVRGQKAREALRPRIAELRRRHARDPERFQRAVLELHRAERVSPLSGLLPGLCQLPAFFLLYHLFSSSSVGGQPNGLLAHRLFDAPLGGRWADALADGGLFGGAGLVYVALFACVAAVATFSWRRAAAAQRELPAQTPGVLAKGLPFLSFFTLVTVAVVPLAAALYIATSTAWGVVERAVLYR
ncbi:YidC/Oxa1 family membrane protein insertase [Streptomyces sp. CRN 30]|uniref:YidC/Oxa1 family membrane protein insertase n=1 Tax=Streptomyces sp. CRN 30 TaxID=3075613 RepID=UPI002A82A31B|nr:membrane protein insertase YidC [Streptomyces sp. CRN 30]